MTLFKMVFEGFIEKEFMSKLNIIECIGGIILVPCQTESGLSVCVCVCLQSAAALCVGVGSFSDPNDLPGLAHFLEHSE